MFSSRARRLHICSAPSMQKYGWGFCETEMEGCCNRILGALQIPGSDQLAGVHPVKESAWRILRFGW